MVKTMDQKCAENDQSFFGSVKTWASSDIIPCRKANGDTVHNFVLIGRAEPRTPQAKLSIVHLLLLGGSLS